MGFRRIPRRTVIGGGAAVIAVAVLATTGIGQAAAASDGPVIYLSRHGAPTDCGILVKAAIKDGSDYSDSLYRPSCDGTLWLPALKTGTRLAVSAWTDSLAGGQTDGYFPVEDTRDAQNLVIDNKTAVCFLAKAGGKVMYTNMSEKGGDCNGD